MLTSACNSSGTYLAFLKDQVDGATLNVSSPPEPSPPIIETSSDSLGYQVSVENATTPFYLVLSESFSPYWQASINNQPLPHSKANSYANAWYISKPGNYYVKIQYFPNLLSYVGLFATTGFAIIVLATNVRKYNTSRKGTRELIAHSKGE
jgi:hypothetical protein